MIENHILVIISTIALTKWQNFICNELQNNTHLQFNIDQISETCIMWKRTLKGLYG